MLHLSPENFDLVRKELAKRGLSGFRVTEHNLGKCCIDINPGDNVEMLKRIFEGIPGDYQLVSEPFGKRALILPLTQGINPFSTESRANTYARSIGSKFCLSYNPSSNVFDVF